MAAAAVAATITTWSVSSVSASQSSYLSCSHERLLFSETRKRERKEEHLHKVMQSWSVSCGSHVIRMFLRVFCEFYARLGPCFTRFSSCFTSWKKAHTHNPSKSVKCWTNFYTHTHKNRLLYFQAIQTSSAIFKRRQRLTVTPETNNDVAHEDDYDVDNETNTHTHSHRDRCAHIDWIWQQKA